MSVQTTVPSPLARVADATPPWLGPALSLGGRAAGAALAISIAGNETYDRTQIYAVGVALLAVASLLIVRAPWLLLPLAEGAAAGVLFFSGAMLWSLTAGMLMSVAGVAALAGTLLKQRRAGHDPLPALVGFFGALGLSIAWVIVVALAVEG